MTRLLAIAGESRSGKGTCAAVFQEEAAAAGLTSLERQLSDNGKWHLARIFKPTISRVDAVKLFEELKHVPDGIEISVCESKWGQQVGSWILDSDNQNESFAVPLQKFLQHGLQEGGRDIFGEHFWTDMIIASGSVVLSGEVFRSLDGHEVPSFDYRARPNWIKTFFDSESYKTNPGGPTNLAIISDMRQVNEAQRVRGLKGRVVQLARPHADDQYKTGSDHITERMLPLELVDHVIANDGDLDHLKETARIVFHKFVLPWLKEG